KSLLIAVILVVLVVYIFLQDIRTTLVPAVTIPVSLIGTFAVMGALGMSINTLSLFGIVLAIGIVVDDAIVVVENVMRLIDEEGMTAKQAAEKAMLEISGPVIATTLVLLAVFVPSAMLSGITGQLYKQFSITISVATVFSTINALTLSPALCGILLRPTPAKRNIIFRGFNKAFDWTTTGYSAIVRVLVRRLAVVGVLFAGLLFLTAKGFGALPTGFIPDEDQGYFIVDLRLPEGATLNRSQAASAVIEERLRNIPGVRDLLKINGYSALDATVQSNGAVFFVVLDDWDDRKDAARSVEAIVGRVLIENWEFQAAQVLAFSPPPIQGLGTAGGFEFQLQDRGGAGVIMLETVANDIISAAAASPALTRMSSALRTDLPQVYAAIDRTKAQKQGVPINVINGTMQAHLGSLYVNDFNIFGRPYRVTVQADQQFRDRIDDIGALEVRNAAGSMIPLATLLDVTDTAGPGTIFRYNLYESTKITGQEAPGFSSGDAIAEMERLAEEFMPPQLGFEWSGVTLQQLQSGNETPFIFSMAIIFIFLVLAAQYESWGIPLAVLMSVPFAVLGAITGTMARSLENNIYMQIGLVLLIGLASKSAILIVEFAKARREAGEDLKSAAAEAARLRFRAILMTAFSSILGFMPLLFASGAGANSRISLGTAVCFGMGAATLGAVLFVPPLYVIVQGMSESLGRTKKDTGAGAQRTTT
ncbi:MAG: efflux RND transporter permease subunit, partial [Myxococcota bacterium]